MAFLGGHLPNGYAKLPVIEAMQFEINAGRQIVAGDLKRQR
jgi:hypothetical protein